MKSLIAWIRRTGWPERIILAASVVLLLWLLVQLSPLLNDQRLKTEVDETPEYKALYEHAASGKLSKSESTEVAHWNSLLGVEFTLRSTTDAQGKLTEVAKTAVKPRIRYDRLIGIPVVWVIIILTVFKASAVTRRSKQTILNENASRNNKKESASVPLLKVGDTTSTGHQVAKILGQGPNGAVYISANNEIRWAYYKNSGVLPDRLGLVVARFDSLLLDIRALKAESADKLSLYELVGKTLYLAFSSSDPPDPANVFADVERRLQAQASATGKATPTSTLALSADVAVVCALHSPELEAVLSISQNVEGPRLPADPQTYHSTEWITKKEKRLRIVLAAPNQMGLTASGVLAAKMVLQFQPRLVVMAGIAAGTKYGKQGFGDIVTPEHTFDYGAAKSIDVGKRVEILPSPEPLSLQAKILGRLKEWQRARIELDAIANSWQAPKPTTRLNIHTGPLFSVPTVQQTARTIDKALSQWRKLSAVEMEAYAVHRACNDTIDPAPMFLCAKSICDFATDKSDEWQHYAAYTSARFIHAFVTAEWETLFPERR